MKSSAAGNFIQTFEREMAVRLAGDGGTLKQLLTAQVRSVLDWVQGKEGLCFYESGAHRHDIWISNLAGGGNFSKSGGRTPGFRHAVSRNPESQKQIFITTFEEVTGGGGNE